MYPWITQKKNTFSLFIISSTSGFCSQDNKMLSSSREKTFAFCSTVSDPDNSWFSHAESKDYLYHVNLSFSVYNISPNVQIPYTHCIHHPYFFMVLILYLGLWLCLDPLVWTLPSHTQSFSWFLKHSTSILKVKPYLFYLFLSSR